MIKNKTFLVFKYQSKIDTQINKIEIEHKLTEENARENVCFIILRQRNGLMLKAMVASYSRVLKYLVYLADKIVFGIVCRI